jgi:DNA-binding NarL/FixJ family response regulator
MSLRLFLVDDHAAILRTLEIVLPTLTACEVVGTATSASGALKSIPRSKPNALWIDVCLAELDGPGLLCLMRSRGLVLPTVLITGSASDTCICEALRADPVAFVHKGDEISCWRKALEAAAMGEAYFSPRIVEAKKRGGGHERLRTLSDMERAVLVLVVRALTKEQIAEQLGITSHTVRHHREKIMKKLNVHTVTDLCREAAHAGLLV